jgi:hypothetical protein
LFFRVFVEKIPSDEPEKARGCGEVERHFPAHFCVELGHEEEAEDGADVGAGVEEAGGESALFDGEPFGDGLDRAGEDATLCKAQCDTREHEAGGGHGERERGDDHAFLRPGEPRVVEGEALRDIEVGAEAVGGGGETPKQNDEWHAAFHTEAVHEASAEKITERVSKGERGGDPAVVAFAPAEGFAQGFLENAEELAIEVIDRDREEQKCADGPAVVLFGAGNAVVGAGHGKRGVRTRERARMGDPDGRLTVRAEKIADNRTAAHVVDFGAAD